MTTSSFPLSGPVDLQVRLGFATITVHAGDDVREAKVVLTPRDPDSDYVRRTEVELHGATLVVRGPKPRGTVFDIPVFGRRGGRDAVDAEITVPAGSTLKIGSWGGEVTVTGRAGTTDIASGMTTVDVEHVEGDLRLRYGSGPVRVQRVSGSIVVRAGSGDATFGDVAGSVEAGYGSGSVEIGRCGGAARMRAGSGQLSIGSAGGDVDFGSGSGGLSVGLRRGRPARLDVVTGSGQVRSDLPIEDKPPADAARAITVKARTGSGEVHVFRAEPPVPDDAVDVEA